MHSFFFYCFFLFSKITFQIQIFNSVKWRTKRNDPFLRDTVSTLLLTDLLMFAPSISNKHTKKYDIKTEKKEAMYVARPMS